MQVKRRWLGITLHMMDNTILHHLDPKHVEICVADTEFCRHTKTFNRELYSTDYNADQHYDVDPVNIYFAHDVRCENVYLPEKERVTSVFCYTKHNDDVDFRYLPMDYSEQFVMFHAQSKQMLAFSVIPDDGVLTPNILRLNTYFREQTDGGIRSADIRAWGQQKKMLSHTSLQQLEPLLKQGAYGDETLSRLQDYYKQHDATRFEMN